MEKSNYIVSVIMPVHNAEKYIRYSIDSVLSQTHPNIELIIINDCSSDKSLDIIIEYSKVDNRIILINNREKAYAAGSRNKGIDIANGEFIAFCDADDVWVPWKLELQLDIMMRYNHDFSFSDYEIINENGIPSNIMVCSPRIATFKSALWKSNIGCLTVIIKRKIIKNMRFPMLKMHEDLGFWLEIFETGIIGYGYGIVLGFYRKSTDSLSSNKINAAKGHWIVLKHEKNIILRIAKYIIYVYKSIFKVGQLTISKSAKENSKN